jgi:serine/threonine-protein kinase HipA
MSELIALAGDREIGRVRMERGQLSFRYSDAWLSDRTWQFPLSMSMPLVDMEHTNRVVTSYLSNLLPDNTDILRRWRQRYGIRSPSPFALLEHVGEDCAGAIQYVRPNRLDALLGRQSPPVQWLSEREIGTRLRELARDQAAWRYESDTGQFSLSGAQPKTALLREGRRWGIPSGRMPTTHILKPPSDQFPGHAENEHFCLLLARRLGLNTALSEVLEFDGAIAIVIERFDRLSQRNEVLRLHTEDFCQALATPPERKYENEGGPGAIEIGDLLQSSSVGANQDLNAFADAMLFNWLIAGTDAHAKNYSLFIGLLGHVRLAPLYDVASILAYEHIDLRAAKLAMRVGRHYNPQTIQPRHWDDAAKSLKVPAGALMQRIRELTTEFPDAIADTARAVERQHLRHPNLARLRDQLHLRVAAIKESLAATQS